MPDVYRCQSKWEGKHYPAEALRKRVADAGFAMPEDLDALLGKSCPSS